MSEIVITHCKQTMEMADALYGPNNTDYPDNAHRFSAFSNAALDALPRLSRPVTATTRGEAEAEPVA